MDKLGVSGEEIMFTSNNTAVADFQKARQMGVFINLDDLNHLHYLEEHGGLPDVISFRYNPGTLKSGNSIIGRPEESKFGVTKAQLVEGYKTAKQKGIARFGLHTMVASNELDNGYFVETAVLLFELIAELSTQLDITFEFVNLGGGLGIPYRLEETAVDLQQISAGIQNAYDKIITGNGLASAQTIHGVWALCDGTIWPAHLHRPAHQTKLQNIHRARCQHAQSDASSFIWCLPSHFSFRQGYLITPF